VVPELRVLRGLRSEKNRNKRKKTGLFFEKNQKIGLFLGCFCAFFRVFKPKNTVPKTGG
jgi:membrane protein DedA with SNARE-associated domain